MKLDTDIAGHIGHRERSRLRARAGGLSELRPYEALELLLGYAVPRADTQALARGMMAHFGRVEKALHASRAELMKVEGMTKAVADWMLTVRELLEAYSAIDGEGAFRVTCFRDVLAFLSGRWRQVRPPESWIVYTDYDNRLITYSVICESLCWWGAEYIREIVMEATALGARHAFLVLYMGVERLALEDWEMESMLAVSRTLRAIDVELVDCVLVGEEGIHSMNMEGGMDRIRVESARPAVYERYSEGGAEP